MKYLVFALVILLVANISFAGCKYSNKRLDIPIPNTYSGSGLVDFSPWDSGSTNITHPDEGYVDPSERGKYKHRVSLKYLRGSVHGEKKWKKRLFFTQGETKLIDLRVKVKNKYKRSIRKVKIDYYYSPNRWFSTNHDELLDTDKIRKLKGRKSKKKHLSRIDISDLLPGKHYFFVDIRYPGNHNISSRKDKTEYFMVRILPPAEPIIIEDPVTINPDGSYPLYKAEKGGYFTKYTLNPENPDTADIIGYAFSEPQSGTVPVHEFESDKQYFYVATDWERDNVLEGKDWDYLGIAFHAYPAGSTEGEPFWRHWHYDSGTHDWTADLSLRLYWRDSGSHRPEGNAWQILNPIY